MSITSPLSSSGKLLEESDSSNNSSNSGPLLIVKPTTFRSKYLHVRYFPQFVPNDFANQLYQHCERLPWGDNLRSTITYGNPGLHYTLQIGKTEPKSFPVIPWSEFPSFTILKPFIENILGKKFNFCAVMRYLNGSAGIKPHKDREMVSGTTIAGLSVGVERTFKIDFPSYSKLKPLEIKLFHGSLYTMEPPTNDNCYHSIPEEPGINGIRYSFTFRDINEEDFSRMPLIPIIRCVATLKSGNRKGEICNSIVGGSGNLCGKHNK